MKNTDPTRNVPSDEGKQNDPHKRDEDARQPGVSTMSSGENDEANQHLTETASDGFREEPKDPNGDKRFNEVGE
jgi:hypothetical protein